MTLSGSGCADIAHLRVRRGFLHLVAIHCPAGPSVGWSREEWAGTAAGYRHGGCRTRRTPRSAPPGRSAVHRLPGNGRGARRSHRPLRPAGDHEHRPGTAVHRLRPDGRMRQAGGRIPMDGQGASGRASSRRYLHRAALGSRRYEGGSLHARTAGSEPRAGLRTRSDVRDHPRPHAARDGQPPDVVRRAGTTITQPDQETRNVARTPSDPAERVGRHLNPTHRDTPPPSVCLPGGADRTTAAFSCFSECGIRRLPVDGRC